MRKAYLASFTLVCSLLIACGGNKNAQLDVEPVATQKNYVVQKDSIKNDVDRYSYALGMDLGKAIANISVPLNMDMVMAAILDEVDTARLVLMDDTASESALQNLLLQMQKKKENDEAAVAKKALEEQALFLAKNIKDTSIQMTPKGVQYKVITEGTGTYPNIADKVKVHYVGALLDGTEFDNSVKRGEPLEFPVSAVIEGWQDLLQVMREGEKVKAWIPSALAYGEAGVPPMIPANALLVFEVELLKVLSENPAAEDSSANQAAVKTVDGVAASSESAAKAVENPKADSAQAETKNAEQSDNKKPVEKK